MSEFHTAGLDLSKPPDVLPPNHCQDLRTTLEWTFQIALPVEELIHVETARQLTDVLMRKLEQAYETDDDDTARSLSARRA